MKNWRNKCRIRFLQKKIFLNVKRKVVKKWHVKNKKVLLKKMMMLKMKKKMFLLRKMYVRMKDDRDSVTWQENLHKGKIGFEIRNDFLSFIVPQGLLYMH